MRFSIPLKYLLVVPLISLIVGSAGHSFSGGFYLTSHAFFVEAAMMVIIGLYGRIE